MTKEDRSHRDHNLNPRSHQRGSNKYDNPSKRKLWRAFELRNLALLSAVEMRFLQDVPRILGSGDYANLGHAKGASAMLLADGLREHDYEGSVCTVDLFPRKNDMKKAMRIAKEYELDSRIEFCRGSTTEWAENFDSPVFKRKFKFIFVDADHTYEAVKNDFYNWSFLLEKGGWISFHDTNQDFSHRALQDTVVGKWNELKGFHVDRIRTFVKPS